MLSVSITTFSSRHNNRVNVLESTVSILITPNHLTLESVAIKRLILPFQGSLMTVDFCQSRTNFILLHCSSKSSFFNTEY